MYPPPQRQRLPIYNNRTIRPLPAITLEETSTSISCTNATPTNSGNVTKQNSERDEDITKQATDTKTNSHSKGEKND